MAGPAETFREIHRLRRFARDLQEQIDRVPRQLQTQKTKVTRQEEAQRENQDAIKHLKVASHQQEVTLKTKHAQIKKHQQQLNEAGSKKEYDALQSEIRAAQSECNRLEEEILSAFAESDERAARLPELEKAVTQARDDYARFEKDVRQRQADLTEQLQQTRQKLQEIETQIPENLRSQYDRQVAAHGADALAAVNDRICAACYTEITVQNYNELRQGHFFACKSCGRILYLAE